MQINAIKGFLIFLWIFFRVEFMPMHKTHTLVLPPQTTVLLNLFKILKFTYI